MQEQLDPVENLPFHSQSLFLRCYSWLTWEHRLPKALESQAFSVSGEEALLSLSQV